MRIGLYILIGLFGSSSYIAGLHQALMGKYKPSVFSRVVWLLLAINTFAGVVASKSSKASLFLAVIFLLGNATMCVVSFWKGTYTMGKLEWVCLLLLLLSVVLWFSIDAPLINLSIGLLAHLLGALPTYRRVWHDSSTESTAFWSLFFIASVLSLAASLHEPVQKILFPMYFALFDGSMTALSLRRIKSSN